MAKLGKNAQRILRQMRMHDWSYGAQKGHYWTRQGWKPYGDHDYAGAQQLVSAGIAEVVRCRELPAVHDGGRRFNPNPIHELVIKLKEEA